LRQFNITWFSHIRFDGRCRAWPDDGGLTPSIGPKNNARFRKLLSGLAEEFHPDWNRDAMLEFRRDRSVTEGTKDSLHPGIRQAPACFPETEIQNIFTRVIKLVGQDISLANAAFGGPG
jgi:hypothetical protein